MNEHKRVFYLTKEWDGLARFVRGQAEGPEGTPSSYLPWIRYKERGYDVHVFMMGYFPKDDIVDFNGCKIHLISKQPISELRGLKWLKRKLFGGISDRSALRKAAINVGDKAPPQIVYSLREGPVRAAASLGKRYKCVVVKRIFGTFFYDWWFFDRRLKKRIQCIRPLVNWLWKADMMIITDDGTNGTRMAEFLRISKDKYRVWLNGVFKDWSSDECDPLAVKKDLGVAEDSFMLLSLARLTKWKRHDRAIRAMPLILKEVPNAELVIGGEGELRLELEALAKSLGVQDSVHMPGNIQHSQVRNTMGATDVLLLPYDLTCLCSTLLEGLICGKALVAWDVGTTNTVITDHVNGRLLPNAEHETIAEAVISIAKNSDERNTLESGARKFAEESLQSWEERCDMEIDLIESLVEQRSKNK